MTDRRIAIVGGGPAGLAAAVAAYDAGEHDVVILERDPVPGGVLSQCIHNGFGLTRFGVSMTGPEYRDRFVTAVRQRGIPVLTDTFVTGLTQDRILNCTNREGIFSLRAGAVILAMGCRERPRGALNIAGTRPAGLFSAGTAQKYVNIYGHLPGKRVVILGSGDIGLIMARRLTLEGATVLCVCEIMDHPGGLRRNIVQCLDDFGIPLLLSHTIVEIRGRERVESVITAQVDCTRTPIPGTETEWSCDTVLFSVGLIPENELTRQAGIPMDPRTRGATVDGNRQTGVPGIFACGNVLHVHDLVDFVSLEAETAGKAAAAFVQGKLLSGNCIPSAAGENVSYVLPQQVEQTPSEPQTLYFRVRQSLRDAVITVRCGEKTRRFRRTAVSPGEMEHVTLTPADLEGASDIRISVTSREVSP